TGVCVSPSISSSALVAQPTEAGDVDHGVGSGIVKVRVEPEPIERLTARRAPIPILAPAAHPHDLPVELRARVEALPLPEATVAALDKPYGDPARLPT